MNPFAAASDAVKLAASLLGLVLLAGAVWWLSTFATAKSALKEIKATDARITRANKTSDAAAKARDTVADAAAALTQQQAEALAKDLNETPDFDDARRVDYLRLLNDALRGAQR